MKRFAIGTPLTAAGLYFLLNNLGFLPFRKLNFITLVIILAFLLGIIIVASSLGLKIPREEAMPGREPEPNKPDQTEEVRFLSTVSESLSFRNINPRFPVLSYVSYALRVLGAVLVLIGLYYFLYEGIIEPRLPRHFSNDLENLLELMSGLILTVIGIFSLVSAEVCSVLIAIERNTRVEPREQFPRKEKA